MVKSKSQATLNYDKQKKEVYNPKSMTEGKRNLIQESLQEYDIETAKDIQDALKDLLSGTVQEMLVAEMDDHLVYGKYERSEEYSDIFIGQETNHSWVV